MEDGSTPFVNADNLVNGMDCAFGMFFFFSFFSFFLFFFLGRGEGQLFILLKKIVRERGREREKEKEIEREKERSKRKR